MRAIVHDGESECAAEAELHAARFTPEASRAGNIRKPRRGLLDPGLTQETAGGGHVEVQPVDGVRVVELRVELAPPFSTPKRRACFVPHPARAIRPAHASQIVRISRGIVSPMLRDSDRICATSCSIARSCSRRRRAVMSRLKPTMPITSPLSSRIGTFVVAAQRHALCGASARMRIGCSWSITGTPVCMTCVSISCIRCAISGGKSSNAVFPSTSSERRPRAASHALLPR